MLLEIDKYSHSLQESNLQIMGKVQKLFDKTTQKRKEDKERTKKIL